MKRWLVFTAVLFGVLATPAMASGGGACHDPSRVVARERGDTVTYISVCTTPTVLEIDAGDTVTWVNNDPLNHTVTSGSGRWAGAVLQQGETFKHTFTKEGTYPYYCTLHGEMGGVIQVGKPTALAVAQPVSAPVSARTPTSEKDGSNRLGALIAVVFAASVGFGAGRRARRAP